MTMDTQAKQIKKLLSQKTAPKGDLKVDFRVALYVVVALYQLDFSNPRNFGMCAHFLSKVGFEGDVSKFSKKDYLQTIDDLVAKGSLLKVGNSSIYAAPCDIKVITTKVKAKLEPTLSLGGDKVYFYYLEDEDGKEYSLSTDVVLLPNDVVEASLSVNSDKAFVNKIVKARQCVLGRLMLLGNTAKLIADEPNLSALTFTFDKKADLGEAKAGDVIIAQITKRKTNNSFSVVTREVVKDIGNLNNIIVMSVLRNDIPYTWPDNFNRVLARVPTEVKASEAKGRVDLRKVPLVTIDGEDARDFDDAVYCQKEGKGWRLFVSIADVSYYVKPNSALDHEAVNRCNSCYFPNFVIPMLPEKLSNGICSLNPDVDRLCMTCEMVISHLGTIESYKFYPAIMRSHARLTYTEAWQMIKEGTAKFEEHKAVIEHVKELYNLYQAFKKARINRGGISIESDELHFVFDEHMDIQGVAPLERNDAHKLIEECMIAANVAAACFVSENDYKTLYRVHAKPMEKKLEFLINQLAKFGLNLRGGDSPTSKDYMLLADAVENREDAKIINNLILRSMSKAEYSPDNIGHFGLALEKYAHFTSPIRRYADLQLHRVIKFILKKQHKRYWGKIGARSYTKPELVALGTKCTDREIAAANAEREVDASLACVYMEKFIGQTVEGTITGCTSFGLFVYLDNFGVDGMVYVGSFDSYMTYNEKDQSLVSDRGQVYSIGKKIKVVVTSVNHEERKVLLAPANMVSKGELNNLKKTCQYALDKRNKIKENTKTQDKETILNSLSDIATAKDANEQDQVVKKRNYGSLMTSPFGEEFNSSAMDMDDIGVFRKKSKKKSFRKGK